MMVMVSSGYRTMVRVMVMVMVGVVLAGRWDVVSASAVLTEVEQCAAHAHDALRIFSAAAAARKDMGAARSTASKVASVREYEYIDTNFGDFDVVEMEVTLQFRSQSFTMRVFSPRLEEDEDCAPAIVMLHPAQVRAQSADTEYWKLCGFVASHRKHCVISLESAGQYGGQSNLFNARSLAERGLLMWRRIINIENDDRGSPLYRRVCRSVATLGYSMGAASAAYMHIFSQPSDNVRAVAPLHPMSIGRDAERIRVPIFVGGSTGDTLTRTSFGLNTYGNQAIAPVVFQEIRGGKHIDNPNGNNCPVIPTACQEGATNTYKHIFSIMGFFSMILDDDRRDWSANFWRNNALSSEPTIANFYRFSRIGASAPNGTSFEFESDGFLHEIEGVLRASNNGIAAEFAVVVTDVSGGCTVQGAATPTAILRNGVADMSLFVRRSGAGTCTLNAWIENVSTNGGYASSAPLPLTLIGHGTACTFSEWTEWSAQCTCCNAAAIRDDGDSRVNARRTLVSWARRARSTYADDFAATLEVIGGADKGVVVSDSGVKRRAAFELWTAARAFAKEGGGAATSSCARFVAELDSDADGELSLSEAATGVDALADIFDSTGSTTTTPPTRSVRATTRRSAPSRSRSRRETRRRRVPLDEEDACVRTRSVTSIDDDDDASERACVDLIIEEEGIGLTESLPCLPDDDAFDCDTQRPPSAPIPSPVPPPPPPSSPFS